MWDHIPRNFVLKFIVHITKSATSFWSTIHHACTSTCINPCSKWIEQITEGECISCQFQSQNDPMYIMSTILHCYQHMLPSGSGKKYTTSGDRGGEGKEKKGKYFLSFFSPEHFLIRRILHPVPSSTCIYQYKTLDTAEWKLCALISVLWLVKK